MAINVDQLRQELKETLQKLKASELNLEAQRVEVKQLNNLYFTLKDEFNALKAEKNDVDQNLIVANNRINTLVQHRNRLRQRLIADQNAGDFEPIFYNKPWHDLRSALSKRKRKKIYRSVIDRTVRQILECSKARVLLTLGHENIVFQWSEQELAFNREDLFNAGYVLPPNIVPVPVQINPVGLNHALDSERTDDPFRITHSKEEIQKVICAMDLHRIPHPAYHEMHLLSLGILPPLNQIKEQKKEMTDMLTFYMIPGVLLKFSFHKWS